tara:strand:+ start:559 stop:981 length:423 start_codon:yes stop_codon:yes gene_type:complete
MEETIKIFVYGTLKSGNSTRGLDSPQFDHVEKTKLGIAKTTGSKFNLVELGAFPGAVINGTHDILGEVWEGGEDFLKLCDGIEGHKNDKDKNFYHRELFDTTEGPAYIYYLDPWYWSDYGDEYENVPSITLSNNTLTWKG